MRFKNNKEVQEALAEAKKKLADEGKDPNSVGLLALTMEAFKIQDMKNANNGKLPTVH